MNIFDIIYEDVTTALVEGITFIVFLVGSVTLLITYPLWVLPYLLIKHIKQRRAK